MSIDKGDDMNISELCTREIEQFGEHVMMIYEDQELTNVEICRQARRLGSALKGLGVGKGDRVIIQMPNRTEAIICFWAVWGIGAVIVPINFMVGERETEHIYRDTDAKVIISTNKLFPVVENCRRNAPAIQHIILTDPEPPASALFFQDLVASGADTMDMEPTEDDDIAALIYTSGTTSLPKGVMLSHYALYANAKMQQDTTQYPPGLTAVGLLPLCHSYGVASLGVTTLVGGGRAVLLDTFDLEKIFGAIEKYRANSLAAVPTMYKYMLMYPHPEKFDLSSMKYWISGSSPLSLATWEGFKEKFGFEIIEGWGMTEAGANNAVNPLDGVKKVGSIGKPMKGLGMKIVDMKGNELPDNREGEIIVSGPTLMKGYWNQPEATAEALRDGWLYTGDIGYRDEDGYYFITERKKDLIIKGGENIAPRQVEEVLAGHPKVSEAAVIGIKDEIYGEDIKAFVVLKPGETATAEELIAHCVERLKRFKSPKEVAFINALPKSLDSKVLKRDLRKL